MEALHYCTTKSLQIFDITFLKGLCAVVISVVFFFFGELYVQALEAILMLMIMDTILGVMASWKEGDSISSKKFSRAVLKGMVYFTAISAGYFADLTIPYNFIQGTMVAFVGCTEFISIIENVGRMGYKTPKKLLGQMRDLRDSK